MKLLNNDDRGVSHYRSEAALLPLPARGRWHPTVPAEVVPVQMASYPHGAIPFRLSAAAVERGAVRLVNPVIPVDKARFAAFLRDWVYDGQTLTDLAKPGMRRQSG